MIFVNNLHNSITFLKHEFRVVKEANTIVEYTYKHNVLVASLHQDDLFRKENHFKYIFKQIFYSYQLTDTSKERSDFRKKIYETFNFIFKG